MEEKEIEKRALKIIADIFKTQPVKIKRDTKFTGDLHAKSIDTVALIAAFNGEFNIRIPVAEVQQNQTVGSAIDYLVKTLIKKS